MLEETVVDHVLNRYLGIPSLDSHAAIAGVRRATRSGDQVGRTGGRRGGSFMFGYAVESLLMRGLRSETRQRTPLAPRSVSAPCMLHVLLSRSRANLGDVRPMLAQDPRHLAPASGHLRSRSTEVWAQVCDTSCNFDGIWPECGFGPRSTDVGRYWPNLARIRPNSTEPRAKFS